MLKGHGLLSLWNGSNPAGLANTIFGIPASMFLSGWSFPACCVRAVITAAKDRYWNS